MKPEDQVTTLETCKYLSDAGIEFDSYFSWVDFFSIGFKIQISYEYQDRRKIISAPTDQELLEKMPINIENESGIRWLSIEPHKTGIKVAYYNPELKQRTIKSEFNTNLAEALALMLLWLHKEGYLK